MSRRSGTTYSTGLPAAAQGADASVAHVADLHITYHTSRGELHAVRGVQLDVERGEIVALVGESGSGKTSIAMALLGLLAHGTTKVTLRGDVNVLGVDVLSAPERERRRLRAERLGAVFQDPMASLNPTMTIGRQITEIAGSPAEATRLLQAVGVSDGARRLKSYPHELSGGQRQRVMIAMAIARSPALVVADEPTTALDVTIQAQILQLIAELRDSIGCAFLLVTHDLGVASQIADRIVVCYAGRVAEAGAASTVLSEPSHPYTAELLGSRLTLQSERAFQLPTLPGEPPDVRRWPPGCPFAPRCAHRVDRCVEVLPEPLPVASGVHSACIRTDELHEMLRRGDRAAAWPETARSSASERPLVEIRDVHKTFHARGRTRRRAPLRALRGLDLQVRSGESVALVGESGSGKSTLLRVIAGLTPVDSGVIELGRDVRVQMVFQDAGASLTPWLSCGEQLGDALRRRGLRRGEIRRRVAEALEIVGLSPSIASRKPRQLSGGQRQRVALARAIASPPALLLCDEPTSSLDVSLAATVLNLIGTLRRRLGMSVLFVTHDLAAARFVADRIAVMYLGQIVEIGPAEELAEQPRHPYTKALVAAVPELGRPESRALGEPASALSPPTGCPFHPRCVEAVPVCSNVEQPLRPVPGHGEAWLAACIHVGETK